MQGKKILIGITGSIAAYKIILLVRLLTKEGAEVKIVMTKSATQFVSPLVLSTLSGNPVLTDLSSENEWANHVMLGRWADYMMIAPLSCNTLSKMAYGVCDNLLLAVYLSATCRVGVAPAMDEDMWLHPTTKQNIEQLKSQHVDVIPVGFGGLASGLTGEGRMAEPEQLFSFLEKQLMGSPIHKNKKVVITAGPTYEHIDPVRFIGNHSSGKMGIALAEAFCMAGAEVHLVLGPSHLKPKYTDIQVYHVTTAIQMYEKVMEHAKSAHIFVMSAAVADYKPKSVLQQKHKKKNGELHIELDLNPDILFVIGQQKTNDQYLVGFALETENAKENALEKLSSKNADCIILNSLEDPEVGFGKDTNKICILSKNGQTVDFPAKSKSLLANDIVSFISKEVNHEVA
ncbi:MAG: bifunctional phosphopantothenoylcysteine decarboxylase/phosphopantothenate--cysteine ligase CoaBC [Hydrotalea sp.]|nr:bifunctional phosphopantothenoylcysteine decarboxylase/phosphopantothenate--cysteine ligase CoaBC [Hydrotalea sp.]